MVAKSQPTQIEQDKLRIDPDFDFRDIAKRPFHDITSNEIGMFKWSGIYHQLQQGYFMMRIRIAGGLLTAEQLHCAGQLAEKYAQNELCITTRQTLQFHWLRKEDLYKVIEALQQTGISTTNCCGDTVRNITTCHLQGVCPHEIGNTRKVIQQIDQDPEFLEKQRNLTRKHKITVSGCDAACGMQLMNCQAWVPIQRRDNDQDNGYNDWEYYAGGGLGQSPYLAKRIFSRVPEHLIAHVSRAAVEAHRRYGDRSQRKLGRLKIIVDKFGQKGFALKLLEIMRERDLDVSAISVAADPVPAIKPAPYVGQTVIAQKQIGLNVVRIMIKRSEISGQEAKRFAHWAKKYGNGEIMLTVRQNLQLRGVPDDKLKILIQAITKTGYRLAGLEHLPDVVACVGTTVCNLAVSDTPNGYKKIVAAFAQDHEYWAKAGPLHINMNGCPNSCAHHWIADIGLRGRRQMQDVGSEEGFSLYVGGSLEQAGHLGEWLIDVSVDEIVPTIKKLIDHYLQQRRSGAERFGDYARRTGVKKLVKCLLPQAAHTPANKRDLALTDTFKQVVREAKQ